MPVYGRGGDCGSVWESERVGGGVHLEFKFRVKSVGIFEMFIKICCKIFVKSRLSIIFHSTIKPFALVIGTS